MIDTIRIAPEIRERCPQAALGLLRYRALVAESPAGLSETLEGACRELAGRLTVPDIAALPHIRSTRNAYKALGKDFHTYRNSAEAMLRRIVQGKGLYRINNAVDINNLVSIRSGYSLGSYTTANLTGTVELRRGETGAHYPGIGKEAYNIEYLPVLCDAGGPFGNPSSDSRRAMIAPGDHGILLVIYSFDGPGELDRLLDETEELLSRHAEKYQRIGRKIVE